MLAIDEWQTGLKTAAGWLTNITCSLVGSTKWVCFASLAPLFVSTLLRSPYINAARNFVPEIELGIDVLIICSFVHVKPKQE